MITPDHIHIARISAAIERQDMNKRTIPAGMLITMTAGVYDDYRIIGQFRAKVNIDVDTVMEKFLGQFPEQRAEYNFNPSDFIEWLVDLNYVEAVVPVGYWHLEDYSIVANELYLEEAL